MITIVIPFYNEYNRFSVEEFITFYTTNPNYSFIMVDDGSKDKTAEMLLKLQMRCKERIEIITQVNKGKAEAVRIGMMKAAGNSNYDYIGYLDADLASKPENFNLFLAIAREYEHQFLLLMGSRVKRLGADINRKLSRHIIGRILATIISAYLLKLPSYDTQCGAKLFRQEVVGVIFRKPFITKWLFDVEVILRLIKNFPGAEKKIMEIPLMVWEDKFGSNLKYTDAFAIFLEIWRIKRKYKQSSHSY